MKLPIPKGEEPPTPQPRKDEPKSIEIENGIVKLTFIQGKSYSGKIDEPMTSLIEFQSDTLQKMKDDSEKWQRSWSNPMNEQYGDVQKSFQIVEHIEKRIKEIRHQLDHTNPDYKHSIALQEALQEMVNLIGFEKYEEIMVRGND